jgi:hypothetical protein
VTKRDSCRCVSVCFFYGSVLTLLCKQFDCFHM